MSKTMTRKSVPLTEGDVLALDSIVDALRRDPRDLALPELAGLGTEPSEASVLHALVAIGARRVREVVDERGYAELAASYRSDPDEAVYQEAKRARRARSAARWDDE